MDLLKIQKELKIQGLYTEMIYDNDLEMSYIDLNTMAKSHLYLYEDSCVRGRYDYVQAIDENDVVRQLCYQFLECLHGRSYYNYDWEVICKNNNIEINKQELFW